MSYHYSLAGIYPFPDIETEAPQKVAAVLGAPLAMRSDGSQEILWDGVQVVGSPADYEDDEDPIDRYLGFRPNFSLVYQPFGMEDIWLRGQVNMIRSAASFAQVDGFVGALVGNGDWGTDTALLLAINRGRLFLNSIADDWQNLPELTAGLTVPFEMRELHFFESLPD